MEDWTQQVTSEFGGEMAETRHTSPSQTETMHDARDDRCLMGSRNDSLLVEYFSYLF
jgi:hypothetical protein